MMVLVYIGGSIVFGWLVSMWLDSGTQWHEDDFKNHVHQTQKFLFCRKRSDTVNFGFFETLDEAKAKLAGDGDVSQIHGPSISVKYSKSA